MKRDRAGVGGVAIVCACALLASLLELMFVSYYVGSTVMPVSLLFAVVGNVAFPRLARAFVDSLASMAAPFVAWLLPMFVLAALTRPEGDVLVPGGGAVEKVYYAVLGLGFVAGLATVMLTGAVQRPPR